MKNKLQVINTKSHGYVLVSDDDIKEGDWKYNITDNRISKQDGGFTYETDIKLIATSTEHKIEGVLQYVVKNNDVEDILNSYGLTGEELIDIPNKPFAIKVIADACFKAAKEKYSFSEQQKWISAEIKPKLATYHLTYSKSGIITISIWNHKYWKSLSNEIIEDITHWMELPKSPDSLKQPTLPDVVEVEYEEVTNIITCKGCEDTDWCKECEKCEQQEMGDTNATGIGFVCNKQSKPKLNSQGFIEIHI